MNIKDIDPVRIGEADKLEAIFSRQRELIAKYGDIERANGIDVPPYPVHIHTHRGQDHLKRIMWWLTEELGEAANTLKLKPWKQTMVESDVDHYHEELIDAFHFFVELLIASGLTPQGILDLYTKKSSVNMFRQRSKY